MAFDDMMESQFHDPLRRRDTQRAGLTRLLRHAKANVPFYGSRLDGVLRHGEIDWDRWEQLPILRRKDVLDNTSSLMATEYPSHHGNTFSEQTTGSTGAMLTVTATDLTRLMMGACHFRAQTWHGLDWSQQLVGWIGDEPKAGAYPEGYTGPPWGPVWEPTATGRTELINRYATPSQVLEFIKRHAARYLTTRPQLAQYLALEALGTGADIALDAIMGFSTAILPDERRDCTKAFGSRLIGPYSSKEGNLMAYQCPIGTHLHVSEEIVLLEIVDENGVGCPPGTVGNVVITPLTNYAQPLIRYDHGDLAVFGPPCSCGRTLKVIDRIVGRTQHMFRFPGGIRVAPTLPIQLKEPLGALIWQIAQIGELELEVRYVPNGTHTHHNESIVADALRQRTHPHVLISFRQVEDVKRQKGGKFIEFVCELPQT
jgi:phenylacetate-CoA ligase